jgi:predicted GIY-YIG superfamily endonuclease
MTSVYLLQSLRFPSKTYTGRTTSIQRRLGEHNTGRVRSTARSAPWRVAVEIKFMEDGRADEIEKYLKSGSGRAFAAKPLLRRSEGQGNPQDAVLEGS